MSRNDTPIVGTRRVVNAVDPQGENPPGYYDVPSTQTYPSTPIILITPAEVSEEETHHPPEHISAFAVNPLYNLYQEPVNELSNLNRRRSRSTGDPASHQGLRNELERRRKRAATDTR